MSLKRNIIAGYASQIYVTLVGILLLPLYIKYMGAEVYGLVGFFTMLQAWFSLLDIGLTPTIARETARYRAGSMTTLAYKQILRALSIIFLTASFIFGGTLWLFSEVIATSWLKATELPITEVVLAVQIMAVSVAMRWLGGLYRSIVTGYECLVWLGFFNVLIATLRFGAVFLSMWVYGFTSIVFFSHQLIVALIELLGLFLMSRKLVPSFVELTQPVGWSIMPIKPLLKFAVSISLTALIWIVLTQGDKFMLSGILSLKEYGYFTLAVLVAGGILMLSAPISLAIMPRMSALHAAGRDDELVSVYRKTTQLVSVISGAAAVAIAFCAEPLIYAWTGDLNLVEKVAPVLRWYAIGNGLLSVGAMPYYLQYAKGVLRYHIIGNVILALIMMPLIAVAAYSYGGVGAGYMWVLLNLLYIIFWIPYVHAKMEFKHSGWIVRDVLFVLVPVAVLAMVLSIFNFKYGDRVDAGVYVFFYSLLLLSCAIISSGVARARVALFLKLKLKSR